MYKESLGLSEEHKNEYYLKILENQYNSIYYKPILYNYNFSPKSSKNIIKVTK